MKDSDHDETSMTFGWDGCYQLKSLLERRQLGNGKKLIRGRQGLGIPLPCVIASSALLRCGEIEPLDSIETGTRLYDELQNKL